MAYSKTTWVDRAVQHAKRYTLTLINGTTYDIDSAPGTITNAGTQINAAKMNNIENGIEGIYNTASQKFYDNTLVADAADITISSIPSCSIIKIYFCNIYNSSGGNQNLRAQFNADTGNNYYFNAGADTSCVVCRTPNASGDLGYGEALIRNTQSYKKQITFSAYTDNYKHYDYASRWDNTSNLIASIKLFSASGDIKAGTRIIVEILP